MNMGYMGSCVILIALVVLLACPSGLKAQDCGPLDPRQQLSEAATKDVSGSISTIWKIGRVEGSYKDVAEKEVKNLYDRYPAADKIVLKDKLIYLFCTLLKESELSPKQKLEEFTKFRSELLALPEMPEQAKQADPGYHKPKGGANNEELKKAIDAKSPSGVKRLVSEGADPNGIGSQGQTALMLAARNNDEKLAGFLLDKGADPNVQDASGKTALTAAVYYGQTQLVKLLLKAGAKVNVTLHGGFTPLMLAAQNNQAEITKLLLSAGSSVNAINDRDHVTALMIACQKGHCDIARDLLAKGANPNVKDKIGRTALSEAERKQHREIVDLLKSHGAR